MKISSLEEYGLRCLLHVAREAADEPVAAADVAESEGISAAYAQKVLRILNRAGLVESVRGANGGFHLARPVESISVGEVVRAVGGGIDVVELCERNGDVDGCCHAGSCTIRPVWSHIADFVERTLDSVSVAMLMRDGDAVARHLDRVAPVPPEMICPVAPAPRERSHEDKGRSARIEQ